MKTFYPIFGLSRWSPQARSQNSLQATCQTPISKVVITTLPGKNYVQTNMSVEITRSNHHCLCGSNFPYFMDDWSVFLFEYRSGISKHLRLNNPILTRFTKFYVQPTLLNNKNLKFNPTPPANCSFSFI